jgi:hypothetical protein
MFDDIFSGDALMGGLSGAATGFMAGQGPGAIIGGIAGAGMGAYKHHKAGQASAAQKRSVDEAMRRLRDLQKESYARRMGDLDKALAFYGPVDSYMQQLATNPYGAPGTTAPPAGMDQVMAGMRRA